MTDFVQARLNMVEGQLRPNKVTDPALIRALLTVEREAFVPKPLRGFAYVDEDLPLGNGRHLEEPLVLARLLNEAEIEPTDIVLDVGCTVGYSCAVMAKMAGTVVGVESDPELATLATAALANQAYDNAIVFEAPHTEGCPKQAPYDMILIHGSLYEVPQALFDQLADGGRLVTVVRGDDELGRATLFRKTGDAISRVTLFDASCPILAGFERRAAFTF